MEKDLKKNLSEIEQPGTRLNVRMLIIAVSFMATVSWVIYRNLNTVTGERLEILQETVKYLKEESLKKDRLIDYKDSVIQVRNEEQKETITKLNYLIENQNEQKKILRNKKP